MVSDEKSPLSRENLEDILSQNTTSNSQTDQEYRGLEYLEQYKRIGNEHSFENDHLHVGLALGLVSQAVGDSHYYVGEGKETTKVHPLIIQGSGTGKDPAFTFAKLVADGAGLRMRDVNDVTNAGLIGTVREDEEEPGLAKTADVIGFREATTLFRTAEQSHSATLAENLNQVLDGRKVHRKLATGSISYKPSCTLVGTTYPPEDLHLEKLMNNGTLARFFYFFKPKDDDYRWRMGERIIEESIKSTDPDEAARRIVDLADVLARINQHFDSGQRFTIGESVEEIEVTSKLKTIWEEYDLETQDIVKPAITRYNIHFLRVACLVAALDNCSTTVSEEHGEDALEIIEESWRNLLAFFERNNTRSSTDSSLNGSDKMVLKAIMQEEGLSQSELADETDLSTRTIRERTSQLESDGLINIMKEGRRNVYELAQEDGE